MIRSSKSDAKNKRACLSGSLFLACLALSALPLYAQDQRGDWSGPGGDVNQSGWQKGEFNLTPENAASQFKFLWKFPFGNSAGAKRTFTEPVMIGRVINGQGFKDIIFGTSADTLYAVDSELGSLIWKKQFATAKTSSGCSPTNLSMLMEPPVVINFSARRKRPAGAPRPAAPPPQPENTERRIGVGAGGGYFGFRGVYLVTADGMLHEQIVTTGGDYGVPVKFLPAGTSLPSALNFNDKVLFAETGSGCKDAGDGIWSVDLKSPEYPVASLKFNATQPINASGPVMTSDGVSILVTGGGSSNAKPEDHAGSVVAVGKDLKISDWYTPAGGMTKLENVSPIIFEHKDKEVVVAPGKDGSIVLLDLASLGGADHQTPLFESQALTASGTKHAWDGFATWTDKAGVTYVFASVSAGVTLTDSAVHSAGPVAHGAVIAFKLADQDGKLSLQPVWMSGDMVNPAPPRIANGVLVALAGGDAQTHAVLHVLNATSGQELYSSKDEVPTYSQLSGVSFGDSHAFFTDHNNVLYSFGIALEH